MDDKELARLRSIIDSLDSLQKDIQKTRNELTDRYYINDIENTVNKTVNEALQNRASIKKAVLKSIGDADKASQVNDLFGPYGSLQDELEAIKKDFENKLSDFLRDYEFNVSAGKGSDENFLHNILNLLNCDETDRFKAELQGHFAEDFNRQLLDLRFNFEDITKLSDVDMQRILLQVDQQEIGVALANSSQEVREKFYRNMTVHTARMLKEDIEFMGPVPADTSNRAKDDIMALIRRLKEEGTISPLYNFID